MSWYLTSVSNFVALLISDVILRVMNNGNDIERSLIEAGEKIRREGYAAGWRDAMAAVAKAASELAPPDIAPSGASEFVVLPPGVSLQEGVAATGIKMGSTPWYVLQAVKRK